MLWGNGFRLGLLAAIAVAPFTSHAASVTQCGPNVCYTWDNAQAAIALTGNPNIVGDSAVFLPPSFIAHSNFPNTAGTVTTTANFIFDRVFASSDGGLTVNPNNEVTSLNVHEEFDYEIISGSPANILDPSQPTADGHVRATLYAQARSNVLATDGTSLTVNFLRYGDTGGNQIGTLDALLDPANVFVDDANDMAVTIQNTLRAITNGTTNFGPNAGQAFDEDAFIQKKFTLVTETLNPVPVPGAVWLLGGALGLLGWIRRQARQAI
jgi:hypothetical protein